MFVDFNYEYRENDVRRYPLDELARYVLEQEECPDEVSCCVTFVDNDEMARLNKEFRGMDGPTDVLSFEADACSDDDEFDWPDDPDDLEEIELGDIIIAPDVAESQAPSFEMTFEGELSLLLVHGLLHLCGYDHIEDEDAAEMQQREVEILTAWAQTHPAVAPPNYHLNVETVVGPH